MTMAKRDRVRQDGVKGEVGTGRQAGRGRVLLIDMENVVGADRPRPGVIRARIGALLAAAGDVHHAVASYAVRDPAANLTVSVLAELGVSPWPVPPGPDAAETALLRHARYAAGHGFRVFVVASGDYRLAEVSSLGRLEVLVWQDHPISRRLQDAAAAIHRLPRPKPGTSTTDPDPAQTDDAREKTDAVHPARRWDGRRYAAAVADDLRRGAAAGSQRARRERADRLLTATATGAAAAVGARIMDRLLPPRR